STRSFFRGRCTPKSTKRRRSIGAGCCQGISAHDPAADLAGLRRPGEPHARTQHVAWISTVYVAQPLAARLDATFNRLDAAFNLLFPRVANWGMEPSEMRQALRERVSQR